MLLHDVALQNLHVVLAVDRAGLVGADGATHHGVADIAFLSHIPNFTVLAPASFAELESMLRQAVLYTEGPVAVRYPRGGQGEYKEDWNCEDSLRLRKGKDVTLVTYGTLINEALEAVRLLEAAGMDPELLKLNTLAPLVAEPVLWSVRKTGRLVVVEDCFAVGSIGQQLCAALARGGVSPKAVRLLNCGDSFVPQGTVAQLRQALKLDGRGIYETVCEVCNGQRET